MILNDDNLKILKITNRLDAIEKNRRRQFDNSKNYKSNIRLITNNDGYCKNYNYIKLDGILNNLKILKILKIINRLDSIEKDRRKL